MNRRWIAITCFTGLAATGLVGCGVAAQQDPHAIDSSDIPFGLAERARPAMTVPDRSSYSFVVYLVAGDHVRAVTRSARSAPSPSEQLRALTRGPSPSEADAGLRSLLPPDVTIDHVRVNGRVVTVGLSGTGAVQPAGSVRALAIAQMVYTATAIPGVERVRFEVDGEPAEVPRGDGTLTSRPVGRSDYPNVTS